MNVPLDVKVPPQSIEAERYLLGALMLDNRKLDDVVDRVSSKDFYLAQHQKIFSAIETLVNQEQAADIVTIDDYLRRDGEDVSGITYLGEICNAVVSTANTVSYANVVRDRAIKRRLITLGAEMVDLGESGLDANEAVAKAESLMMKVSEDKSSDGPKHIKESLGATIDDIERRYENKGKIVGLPTGYTDIDRRTGGFEGGDLIILAGRPGMGKTSLAMNIAENVSVDQGKKVVVFSLEMPVNQLNMRMISGVSRVSYEKIRQGEIEDDEWHRISSSIGKLDNSGIMIDDAGGSSMSDIKSRIRREARKGEIALVVIDYIQLIEHAGEENETLKLGYITRNLKGLAKQIGAPILALSQLNRGVESRANKRPQMSDLRQSGAIEQDADIVMMIYRDEVYYEDSVDAGLAEIITTKQRNGTTGTDTLAFLGSLTRFENSAKKAVGYKPPKKNDKKGFD